ncbi:MAG TPA: PIN domain-containing protein [Streptosporangiaceae bacterium]|nr:PIN domain-containing protein [Streptosporangiaceae bacterium]
MIIWDTGPLFAAADVDDRDHGRWVNLMQRTPPPLLMPVPVLTEVGYLLERGKGARAEAEFIRSIQSGQVMMVPLTAHDLDRMAGLVEKYADFPLGLVDASVIAVAERLGAESIATLDHRHFSVMRPAHLPAFRLLPDSQ